MLVYKGPDSWPNSDTVLVNPDGSWRIDPYDFDEFIQTCQEIGAEPVVVVCYNSSQWPAPDGVQKPTKQQIIENAVSWVHYANIKKDYNVKYWEIGNETLLDWTGIEGSTSKIAPDIYGADLSEIAAAMKAVDPDCYFSQFWNTINVYEGDNSVFNALYCDNTLTSVGKVLWIWGNYLEDEMLLTTSSSLVKCFATLTPGETMNVFLVNWDTIEHHVQLEIMNEETIIPKGSKCVFTGTSLRDQNPVWTESGAIRLKGSKLHDILDPFSINMYSFKLGK